MIKQRAKYVLEGMIAGSVLTLLLVYQVPKFISIQGMYSPSHHPDYALGALQKTGDPFDIAIVGRGYFQVRLPDGAFGYTRNSEFMLDETGQVVTKHGFPLADGITIPQQQVRFEISPQGICHVIQQPGHQRVQIGQLMLTSFVNPEELDIDRYGYYRESEKASPPTVGNPMVNEFGYLLQGYRLLSDALDDTPEHLLVNGEFNNGYNDRRQEPLVQTGRDMDFAIDGPGWAAVTLPSGETGYTRRLTLATDEDGMVRIRNFPPTHSGSFGLPVLLDKITPDHSIEVWGERIVDDVSLSTGAAVVTGKPLEVKKEPVEMQVNVVEPEQVMKAIQLYAFQSPDRLHYLMNGIYIETNQSGPALQVRKEERARAVIKQGYLNDVPRLEP